MLNILARPLFRPAAVPCDDFDFLMGIWRVPSPLSRAPARRLQRLDRVRRHLRRPQDPRRLRQHRRERHRHAGRSLHRHEPAPLGSRQRAVDDPLARQPPARPGRRRRSMAASSCGPTARSASSTVTTCSTAAPSASGTSGRGSRAMPRAGSRPSRSTRATLGDQLDHGLHEGVRHAAEHLRGDAHARAGLERRACRWTSRSTGGAMPTS